MKKITPIDAIVFDLGGVLIDWNPRYLYKKIYGEDEKGLDHFLTHVCHTKWSQQQDGGRSWSEAIDEAIRRFPEQESNIRAYYERWDEMLGGSIDGTVNILKELKVNGLRLFALTNWSAETFPIAEKRFVFLNWFDGILVSGREKLVKPDPAFFQRLIHRYHLDPSRSVFIDDLLRNTNAAEKEGFLTIQFTNPDKLRQDLRALGVPLSQP